MRSFARALAVAGWLTTLPAPPAAAQTPRWAIEVYGGLAAPRATADESLVTTPAGTALVTSNPIFPTRQVPSWFFGDGATLLNGVAAVDGSARIAPLDTLFGPLDSGAGAVAGLRLRYRLTSKFSAEVSLDAGLTPGDRSSDFDDVVEASRASFVSAIAGQLASGPFVVSSVTATAAPSADTSRRDIAVTASLVRHFGGAWSPYVTFGAGVVAGAGSLPSATLEGRYRFSILGAVPIDETDRVALRFERGTAFTTVFGGGIQRPLSGAWSWTIDGRILFGPDPTRVTIDAHPANVTAAPPGFIQSTTNPSIQFSSDPAIGRQSTLSGAGLDGFEVFRGGVRLRPLVTFGVVRRF